MPMSFIWTGPEVFYLMDAVIALKNENRINWNDVAAFNIQNGLL